VELGALALMRLTHPSVGFKAVAHSACLSCLVARRYQPKRIAIISVKITTNVASSMSPTVIPRFSIAA